MQSKIIAVGEKVFHEHENRKGGGTRLVELVCPCCNGQRGGKRLAEVIDPKVRQQWGKLGGRPRHVRKTSTSKHKGEKSP